MQDPPRKKPAREIAEKAVEAGAGMIPLVGSAVAAAFSYAVGYAFNNRMQLWFEEVASAIQKLQDESGPVDFERIAEDPVFVDAVVHATRAAQGTHQREKLEALRNGVLNSVGPDAPSADEQRRFLRLVDEFSPAHLRMLRLWADPRAFFEAEGIPEPDITIISRMTLVGAVPDFAGRPDWVGLIENDLNSAQLMSGSSNSLIATEQGLYQSPLTDLGHRFLAFVSDSKSDKPARPGP